MTQAIRTVKLPDNRQCRPEICICDRTFSINKYSGLSLFKLFGFSVHYRSNLQPRRCAKWTLLLPLIWQLFMPIPGLASLGSTVISYHFSFLTNPTLKLHSNSATFFYLPQCLCSSYNSCYMVEEKKTPGGRAVNTFSTVVSLSCFLCLLQKRGFQVEWFLVAKSIFW